MKLFWSDFSSSHVEHANQELARYGVTLNCPSPGDHPCEDGKSCPPSDPPTQPTQPLKVYLEVFIEQCINAAIVGGIAGLSALAAGDEKTGLKVGGVAFGLAFLFELRKYRKL